jgi:[ribosomal protein S5]-alanine N-acetyltransferase
MHEEARRVSLWDYPGVPARDRTRARFQEKIRHEREWIRDDRGYRWQIILKSTGAFVGWIDFLTICRFPYQAANFGYLIIQPYQGNGYAREASARIIRAGFEDLKYHRLEAAIDPKNRPSIALARSVGLYKEGIKKHYWLRDGRWEDQLIYMLTPELQKKTRRHASKRAGGQQPLL